MTDVHTPQPTYLLRTLGAAELVRLDDTGKAATAILGASKPLALLAFCACSRERELGRDLLASMLWSDSEPVRARQSLRQAIWRLRRIVGESLIVRDETIVGLTANVTSDRERFLETAHRGDAAAALAIYNGAFLSGLSLPGGDDFEDWASFERRQIENTLLRLTERHARDLLRDGRRALLSDVLDRLLVVAPDSMDAHQLALELRLEMDDRTGAARVADALEAIIQEVNATGTPKLSALIARARASITTSVPDAPRQMLLDLVGREAAFDTVLTSWTRSRAGKSQLVLLSGVPGIGKSRLLSAIAKRCRSRTSRAMIVRANAGERDIPFGFASAIARALSELPGALGVSQESARELVALDPALGASFTVNPAKDDGRETVRRRALAMLDLLSAICEQSPLALCLDDMHWADHESMRLLGILAGRVANLPLMIVATSRPGIDDVFPDQPALTIALEPLSREQCIDAVTSLGNWPDEPGVSRFVEALAHVSGGNPQAIVERLDLARELGVLEDAGDVWTSPNWESAVREIGVASPLGRRFASWTPDERTVLLMLAAEGAPLSERTLHDIAQRSQLPMDDALAALEQKGVVTRGPDAWRTSHDHVAEAMLRSATEQEIQAAHAALARAYASASSADAEQRALRHYISAADMDGAGASLRRVVTRFRRRGDQRPVRDILTDVCGPQLTDAQVRELVRRVAVLQRFPAANRRAMIGVLAAAVVYVAGAWTRSVRLPPLVVEQASPVSLESSEVGMSSSDTIAFGPNVRRAQLPIIISPGGSSEQLDSAARHVRVRSLSPTTRIVAGDSAPLREGIAAFNRLRFFETGSATRLRFEMPGYRPVDVTLQRQDVDEPAVYPARLRLLGGSIEAQLLDVQQPKIEVPAGERIRGTVELEFDTPYSAASVWLSMTPTWGDPRSVGVEVSPVPTPVRGDLLSVPIDIPGPTTAGSYWLIFIIAAEPSGMFGLSTTNWTVETPIWGDGNDIATLPDSAIRRSNATGFVDLWLVRPADWPNSSRCTEETRSGLPVRVRYCPQSVALAAIEIVAYGPDGAPK